MGELPIVSPFTRLEFVITFLGKRKQKQYNELVDKVTADILRQTSGFSFGGSYAVNEDSILRTKGIAVYREMLRDAEVYADVHIRISSSIPGLNIQPQDESPEAEKAANFIKQVIDQMPGSFPEIVRDQIYFEGLITGMSITEPVQTMIDTTDFGRVKGLAALKIARSEDFQQGIEKDEYGNILSFNQTTFGKATLPIKPSQVLYYAHEGTPANRLGTSILRAAYDPYVLKHDLTKLYAVFATVNASGLRVASIPDDDFLKEQEATLARLKKMAEFASIVKPKSQDLDIQIPPDKAGGHFIQGVRELCNKEIRKAILFDETFNAEGQHTGSFASKKVSQAVVYEAMAVEGAAFCDSVIREQLFRMILEWNGLGHLPLPLCIPEPAAKKDGDISAIIASLGTMKTSGLLTVALPEGLQKQIVEKSLDGAGIVYDALADQEETPDPIDEEALNRVYDHNLPVLHKALSESLGRAYTSGSRGDLRKAVEKVIATGGPAFRKTLIGLSDSDDPTNDAYLKLKRAYNELTEAVFYNLSDSLKHQLQYDVGMDRLEFCLQEQKSKFVDAIIKRT